MAIRKTKLVVLAGFLLFLPGLLMLGASTNAQKRRTGGSAPSAAQPAAQFKTCPVCNGSGKTHEHVAKYEEVRCSNCAGKGETLCDSHSGWPHSDDYYRDGRRWICVKCNGNGRVRCPVCSGSGTRSVDRGYDVTKVCYNCKGSGRVPLSREEVRAKEEVRLEAERRKAKEAKLATSLKNTIGMELILIRSGEFQMGSNDGQWDEKPVHEVAIVKPFYMGRYEVTQAQWRAVMGNNPSRSQGDDLPVEQVSWDDAISFCQKLSQMTGQEYRLPTEAEWEYAARGGSTTSYSFGNDVGQLGDYAWFRENSGSQPHPVAQKKPNRFGLHDMHGNVYEWCSDWYSSNYYAECQQQGVMTDPQGADSTRSQRRVNRGGSWYGAADTCKSANRASSPASTRLFAIGFRVVMSARIP